MAHAKLLPGSVVDCEEILFALCSHSLQRAGDCSGNVPENIIIIIAKIVLKVNRYFSIRCFNIFREQSVLFNKFAFHRTQKPEKSSILWAF